MYRKSLVKVLNMKYIGILLSFSFTHYGGDLEGSNRILASPAQDDEGEHRQPVEDPGREREEV